MTRFAAPIAEQIWDMKYRLKDADGAMVAVRARLDDVLRELIYTAREFSGEEAAALGVKRGLELNCGRTYAALTGAVVAVLIVQALAGLSGNVLTIILAGVAVSSFAGAMTSLALNLSPNPFAALEIVFWMLGSLNDRSMTHVWLSLPVMMVGWAMLAALVAGERDPDALAEMARAHPGTLDELGQISGVGAKKLEAYGSEILRVLGGG